MSSLCKLKKSTLDLMLASHEVSESNNKDGLWLVCHGHVQWISITRTGSHVVIGGLVYSKRAQKTWYRTQLKVSGANVIEYSCACDTA